MNQEQCQASGEQDAVFWMRHDAPFRYVKALADAEGLYNLKKKLDRLGGWWGLMREDYPELCEDSACLSRTDTTERERHAWSLGFEARAVELAKQRMGR